MKFVKTQLVAALLAICSVFAVTPAAHATVIFSWAKLIPTSGTTSFYQGVTYQGITRSVLFIRPTNLASGKAPAIVMLHYHYGSPILQANLSRAGELAAKMGYWVILPPAVNGHWNDDPADTSTGIDDVGFLKTLIKTAEQQYPIDSTRVSMVGLSNGGIMTFRMACEAPELLASAVAVAAEMRSTEAKVCAPARPVPMAIVMGTADPLLHYNGSWSFNSAQKSFTNWVGYSACANGQTSTESLPVSVNDGTSVTLQHNAVCTSLGEADLYTVKNGGHAWPGGTAIISPFGTVSQNLDTTTMIGNFAKQWTNKSTN